MHAGVNTLEYRRDIDGLRAVAILSVIIFHAFPSFLKGGFVGVDIFFFISGYLISSIILNGLAQNKFKFLNFYGSRIRRIFPALVLMLSACASLGWMAFFPIEYQQLGKHLAGGLSFIDNFLTYREIGYFDTASELKPLLHLWSLSIEEQFYIIFPFIIWFLWKINPKFILPIISFAILVSFLMNIKTVSHNSQTAFFLPHARVWELLTGCLCAYFRFFYYQNNVSTYLNELKMTRSQRLHFFMEKIYSFSSLKNLFSIIGLSLLIISIFFIHQERTFPGYWPLLPLVGTALLIISGSTAVGNRYVLSHPFMVRVGLISYPLYLWHWPILSFLKIIHAPHPSIALRCFALLLSFILAWLTYILIEKPIRFGKYRLSKTIMLCFLASVIGYLGMMMFYKKVQPHSVKAGPVSENIIKAIREWEYPAGLSSYKIDDKHIAYRVGDSKKITLFYGDSNMEQYSARIVDLFKNKKINERSAVFFTFGGCPAIPAMSGIRANECNDQTNAFLNLAKSPNIDRIVIASFWFGVLNPDIFKNNKKEALRMLANFEHMIQTIARPGRVIYLVLNIPFGKEVDPLTFVNRDIFHGGFSIQEQIKPLSRSLFMEQNKEAYEALQLIAKKFQIVLIDPTAFLCKKNLCSALDTDGQAKYMDYFHLRPTYVRKNISYLDVTVA